MTLHFSIPGNQDEETVELIHTDKPPSKQPRLCKDGKVRFYRLVKVLPCMTSSPSVMHVYYEELPFSSPVLK